MLVKEDVDTAHATTATAPPPAGSTIVVVNRKIRIEAVDVQGPELDQGELFADSPQDENIDPRLSV